MKDVKVDNLQFIFNLIDAGLIEHNQEDFFCGTSCCIAGWDLALTYPEKYYEALRLGLDGHQISEYLGVNDTADWSKKNNNLTHSEAILLFDMDSTRMLQDATMRALALGKRFKSKPFDLSVRLSNDPKHGYISIYIGKEEVIYKLNDFLEFPEEVETKIVKGGLDYYLGEVKFLEVKVAI